MLSKLSFHGEYMCQGPFVLIRQSTQNERSRGVRKFYNHNRVTSPVINEEGFFVKMGTASKLLSGLIMLVVDFVLRFVRIFNIVDIIQ